MEASGYRRDTVERAVRIAHQYISFSIAQGLDLYHKGTAEAWLAGASRRNVCAVTLLNYWKDLKLFGDWAVSEGLMAKNPVLEIRKPRPSMHERERDVVYSEFEVQKLLATCPTWTWIGFRDAAIIWLLWETGIRAQELCDLLVTDLDFDEGEIVVRDGKAGVRYEAVLTPAVDVPLRRWLLRRRFDGAMLFTDQRGGPLTRHALELMLRRRARRAGWAQNCFPHGFRHSFRARMKALGLDDADISALLGHSTIRSTWTYGRREAKRLAKERLRNRLAG